ncbi:VQ motif-containing protein 8, chloroplastic-like [Cornus florida]|uniref:VQ motif-containing protein 8, chloroplastic-like n=1 Tax=Cornus florida TaxID=4283 RepID=UPI00289C0CEE|nr:VQ motif-containing protein 8, chloroplastic-like [Cornus florida]
MVSRQLNGPRPPSLMVKKNSSSSSSSSSKMKKPSLKRSRSPVIVYERSPKIIHVSPREFMSLVQRLTGKDHHQASTVAPYRSSSSASSAKLMEVDEITSKRDQCIDGKMEFVSSEMGSINPSSFSAPCGTGLSVDIYPEIQKFGGKCTERYQD